MDKVIETADLTKRYRALTAVDAVNLSVSKGEIYGFLGLNGAGKTTTIRMLLGMIRPTAGEARVCGARIGPRVDRSLWNRVGHLVESPSSYPDLTVAENLEVARRLRLIGDPRAVPAIVDRLHLGEYLHVKARHLSLGNAQRLGLAKAMLHNPEILILDEPSNALDPAGIAEIRAFLLDLARERGVTIFISSHILAEIAKFAGRIGIIHRGRLVQEMDAAQLERFRRRVLVIDTQDNGTARAILAREGYVAVPGEDGGLEVLDDRAIQHPEVVNALLAGASCVPRLLKVNEEDLESIFFRVIGVKGGGR